MKSAIKRMSARARAGNRQLCGWLSHDGSPTPPKATRWVGRRKRQAKQPLLGTLTLQQDHYCRMFVMLKSPARSKVQPGALRFASGQTANA